MTPNMENYLRRHGIKWHDIKYILREDGKTIIYCEDNNKYETYNTVKSLLNVLPEEEFVSINKGIVLAKRKIVSVSGCLYKMNDGTEYYGRAHQAGGHTKNIPNVVTIPPEERIASPEFIVKRFSVFDKMPYAFCIIELIFNEDGKGMDFVFRYVNKQMEVLEGKKVEEMMNRSFYEVFKNASKKWLVPYADTAINGNPRVIEREYSEEIGGYLSIFCIQVAQNHCACVLVPVE